MKLLLHCCCGPCATAVADHFRGQGDDLALWFFNPNLHPEEERHRREKTLVEAARRMELPLLPSGPPMTLADFLQALARHRGPRCHACYQLRLEASAREAAKRGYDGFSSTLLVSPYQDLDALREIGAQAAAQHRVAFRFSDLRAQYGETRARAREIDLYRQNYCGCLFSALERAERRARRRIREPAWNASSSGSVSA